MPGSRRARALAVATAAALACAVGGAPGLAHASSASPPDRTAATGAAAGRSGDSVAPAGPADPRRTAEQAASRSARGTGKPVVVDAETDTGTLLTANPDGSFTLTESSQPVRVREQDTWVPIDPTLSESGGRVRPAATEVGLSFSDGGSGPMATLSQGTNSLSFTFPGTLPAPVLSGPTATYPNVLPGVDLRLTANSGGFSELLVVHSAAAAANPKLRDLALGTTTTGLTLSDTADGGAQATDSTGASVFHADTALEWDSATARAGSPAGAASLTGAHAVAGAADASSGPALGAHVARVGVHVNAGRMSLSPGSSLLGASSTVYPAYVDPAWSGNPSQLHWARISSNGWNIYDSTSTADGDHPRAGLDPEGAGETARTYYQMNTGGTTGTTGIGGATVTAATLYVSNVWSAYSAPTNAAVYITGKPVGNAWNSTGLNWSNKPTDGGLEDTASSYESGGTTVVPGTLSFDILDAASQAAAKNWSNITLDLRAASETDPHYWKQFASGGGASISVTYFRAPDLVGGTGNPVTSPSSTDAGTTFLTSTAITMKVTAEDTDGENVRVGYEIWNWAGGAATTNVANSLFSGYSQNGGAVSYSGLVSGHTYAWHGSGENTNGMWTPWSAWQVFTVDTSAPNPPSVNSPQFPPSQYGAAFGTPGSFELTNDLSDNVKGYLVSMDGDLGSTVYNPANPPATWTGTGVPTNGKIYWLEADDGNGGSTTEVVNGYANPTMTPNTVGPHRLYAKAVDQAGITSAETTYLFYAGLTNPTYVYGDQLVNGYTAADGTLVPAGSATVGNNAQLEVQGLCCGQTWPDGHQAMLANGAGAVQSGDTATLHFDIPTTGYWDLGADLTKARDYGQYTLTLDQGTSTSTTLDAFDAYTGGVVVQQYVDFGFPKASDGTLLQLAKGVHTLTLTITGKNTAASGYQAGIPMLRLAPTSASCTLTNLTACQDNTAISLDTASPFSAADADGYDSALSSTDLATAGWTPGAAITVDGAPMSVPSYAAGKADNIVAGGQLVTVPSSGVANNGNAVVFLGFAADGDVTGASGTITYAGNCNGVQTQPYTIDTMPDWISGPATQAAFSFPRRVQAGSTYDTTHIPQLFAVSVPLTCPGQAIASVSLPVVSNGVVGGVPSMHILGLGIRPSSFTSTADTQMWTGTFAARQDTHGGTWTDQTFRIPVRVSVGDGTNGQIRLHLSNVQGTTPATFTAVTVAPQDTTAGGATAASAPVPVLFGTAASVTVPAGGSVVSDPVQLTVADQSTLLVSIALSGSVPHVPGHGDPQSPVYATVAGTGDHTGDLAATAFTVSDPIQPYLTGIDVTYSGNTAGSLVLFGDHTVNADSSSGDGQRLSDQIAAQLAAANGGVVPYGVLNEGQNNWNTGNNLLPTVTGSGTPTNAIGEADADILAQTNVRTVLISTGTDDLLAGASYSTVENELIALASQARHYYTDAATDYNVSLNNGAALITVYVSTIPPDARYTAAEETVRETVNNYILCGVNNPAPGTCTGLPADHLGGNSDGAIDFAAAVSTDNTDTGATVATGDLYNGDPDNAYYQALATEYIKDSANGFNIQPMTARAPVVTVPAS